LSEPPELSAEEALSLWGTTMESAPDCARRIYRTGWDAAMAAVIEQCMAAAEAAPDPAPSAPGTLVKRLAFLIAGFASTTRVGDDAIPAAIAAVRMVEDWLRRGEGPRGAWLGSAADLSEEAARAAAELEGQG